MNSAIEPDGIVEVHFPASYQSGWTRDTTNLAGRNLLRFTDDWMCFDRPLKKDQWERLFDVPIAELERVEVESISGAGSEFGWKPTTGFLHGSSKVAAVTGLLVVLTTGEHVLFRLVGLAPIEVRAQLGPLLARLGT